MHSRKSFKNVNISNALFFLNYYFLSKTHKNQPDKRFDCIWVSFCSFDKLNEKII